MSRIGRQPVLIPENVSVKMEGEKLMVSGPKGELILPIPRQVEVKVVNGKVICQGRQKGKGDLWGLTRTLIANSTIGVSQGWTKTLELVGVGFRAAVEADSLVLSVGFSHPVEVEAPPGITFIVAENKVHINGIDKQLVGEMAARIRRIRPPEPYKGKGIRYQGEKIVKKAGKVTKTIGAGPAGGKL